MISMSMVNHDLKHCKILSFVRNNYEEDTIKVVHTFKYLEVHIHSQQMGNMCLNRRMEDNITQSMWQ